MDDDPETTNDNKDAWTEGLPTEVGDYWFYTVRHGHVSGARQGRTGRLSSGELQSLADDFFYAHDFDNPRCRVWHRPLDLPPPPVFDRTCVRCEGTGKGDWMQCHDCKGKGSI